MVTGESINVEETVFRIDISRLRRQTFLATAIAAMFTVGANGQTPSTPSVSGSGSAEAEQLADVVRVQVQVRGEGKDLREALSKLKEKQASLKATLEKLRADPASIKFGPAAEFAANDNNSRARMEMMRMRMGQRGKRGKKEAPKAVVVVLSSSLTAEWPLKAADVDELLINGKALEDQIKAADLGGMKAAETKAKTDEDEESKEEMQEMMMQMGNDNEPKPGEPTFVYARKISNEVRAKLLSEAYAKAKVDAARLASAAGKELGELRTLNENAGPASDDSEDPYLQRQYYRAMQGARMGRSETADGPLEAVGVRPGMVAYRVTVGATFALK